MEEFAQKTEEELDDAIAQMTMGLAAAQVARNQKKWDNGGGGRGGSAGGGEGGGGAGSGLAVWFVWFNVLCIGLELGCVSSIVSRLLSE